MNKRVTVIVEGREYIVEVGDLKARPIQATVNGTTYDVQIPLPEPKSAVAPGQVAVSAPQIRTPAPKAIPTAAAASGTITAPMPGDICEIQVKVGAKVNAGDVVCVLEAMKMKNLIHTPVSGKVVSVEVAVGQSVEYGASLMTVEQTYGYS